MPDLATSHATLLIIAQNGPLQNVLSDALRAPKRNILIAPTVAEGMRLVADTQHIDLTVLAPHSLLDDSSSDHTQPIIEASRSHHPHAEVWVVGKITPEALLHPSEESLKSFRKEDAASKEANPISKQALVVRGSGIRQIADPSQNLKALQRSAHDALEAAKLRAQIETLRLGLQESERLYHAISSSIGDGVWDWDLATKQVRLSKNYKEMLGLQSWPDIVDDEQWLQRLHPDDRPQLEEAIAAHFDDLLPRINIELRIRHNDGQWRWMVCQGHAIHDEAKRPHRILGLYTDLHAARSQTAHLSSETGHDPLTGLPGHRLFRRNLQQALDATQGSQERIAVILIDLDGFQSINDGRGRTFGDKVLVTVAQRLLACLRKTDEVSRIGSDEFAVLLRPVSAPNNTIETIRDRIHQAIASPIPLEDETIWITTSMGLSTAHASNADEMIREAETAMHRAKSQGRAQTETFDSHMQQSAIDRIGIEIDLRSALANGELALNFQPIVDLETGKIQGAETLLRWHHPKRGNIDPERFIGISEDTGLIVPIGAWIIETACAKISKWKQASPAYSDIFLTINVSPKQFEDPNLPNMIDAALVRHHLEPSSLRIEITETMLLKKTTVLATSLKRLHDMGIAICIDDFGTGFSSLSLLDQLPLSGLKIDRSFIANASPVSEDQTANTSQKNASTLIQTIVLLAQGLGLDVVAEGIETPEQMLCVRNTGCRLAQGFLFSRPIQEDEFERMVCANQPLINKK